MSDRVLLVEIPAPASDGGHGLVGGTARAPAPTGGRRLPARGLPPRVEGLARPPEGLRPLLGGLVLPRPQGPGLLLNRFPVPWPLLGFPSKGLRVRDPPFALSEIQTNIQPPRLRVAGRTRHPIAGGKTLNLRRGVAIDVVLPFSPLRGRFGAAVAGRWRFVRQQTRASGCNCRLTQLTH